MRGVLLSVSDWSPNFQFLFPGGNTVKREGGKKMFKVDCMAKWKDIVDICYSFRST
jgi:hypothetical protein